MTLKYLLKLKSVFIVDLSRFFCLAFENNTVVKTNEDIPTLSTIKMFTNNLSLIYDNIKFMWIFARALARLAVDIDIYPWILC